MKKMTKRAATGLLFFAVWLLGGSLAPLQPPQCRYVIRADVVLYQHDRQLSHTYLQPQKIRSVLTYLRLTEPRGKADAEQANPQTHDYCITLHYSDGSKNIYRLQDYRFFSKNGRIWQKVATTHAQLLYPLLHLLPADQ